MKFRMLAASLGVMVALGLVGCASAQDQADAAQAKGEGPGGAAADAPKGKTETAHKIEKATFGGGCFWCMEAVFERLHGVKSVVSGYAGGNVAYPTYEMVHTGLTGHAEVIQIEYDPAVVSYEKLLSLFWASHDPTTLNMQGVDIGTQYRSVIFYHSEDQKKAALKSYQDLTARHVFKRRIVTELVPITEFYPAEPYHQNYYRTNPYSEYSLIHIAPKLRKLKVK
jgi:peptide-methionine (S)-S-oxide reductase